MFIRLNKQGVRSSDGYEVQVLDRFTVEYREASSKITVPMEIGLLDSGKPCISINPDAFDKWDDCDNDLVGSKKRDSILRNFREGMQFLGVEVVVEPPLRS